MNIALASKIGLGLTLLGALLAGCGGSDTSGSGGGGAGGATTTTTTSDTTTGGSGGETSTGGSATPGFVAQTDPTKGELPEGLYASGDTAYMGFAALGTIEKVALADGTRTAFGSIPPIPANGGYMLGITADAAGDIYVGFGGGDNSALDNGVYKLPKAGGAASAVFAKDAAMNFPNGLVFDGASLFVADSGGTIFKIGADGLPAVWSNDPALSDPNIDCQFKAPFPLGANGIVKIGDAFYVSNTNAATIVKVPVQADGTAGDAAVIAGPDCAALGGVDGIAVDADGASLLAVVNSQSRLVRIDMAGKITTVLEGAPLDNPASIAVVKGADGATAYITNSSFFSAAPKPGLVSVPLP
ncbi:MAG: SMP-30/gluconolactonase/LRE family protein [Polyangiaceae bacterium]